MSLLEKRAALVAEHQAVEKHNPAWHGSRLASRPIAFVQEDEIVVVGECVATIYAVLKSFMDFVNLDRARWDELAKTQPDCRIALKNIGKLLASPPPEEIRVSRQVWNSYLYGLNGPDQNGYNPAGIHVVLAEG